ncbi:hypothetical protein MSAN_00529000 [Mycena sanguinolenta]|uniref:Uncharacterized protein n=1 Tax=Mycena sanguinolenta TaxID=230812 RepID=A0A8H6Z9N1_9AGAR|nr:hypothetical protein MSAN_00529000 [Mycena sanguinolenta]
MSRLSRGGWRCIHGVCRRMNLWESCGSFLFFSFPWPSLALSLQFRTIPLCAYTYPYTRWSGYAGRGTQRDRERWFLVPSLFLGVIHSRHGSAVDAYPPTAIYAIHKTLSRDAGAVLVSPRTLTHHVVRARWLSLSLSHLVSCAVGTACDTDTGVDGDADIGGDGQYPPCLLQLGGLGGDAALFYLFDASSASSSLPAPVSSPSFRSASGCGHSCLGLGPDLLSSLTEASQSKI